jgi:3-oxoacyl-[acyl-carrier-protein] synthase-1
MRKNFVSITGMGIISSIGDNLEENLSALINKKVGLDQISHINTIHKNKIKVGEIKHTNNELIDLLCFNKNENYSRTELLGSIAAKEAIKHSGIKSIDKFKTGLISATSVGGMVRTEKFYLNSNSDDNSKNYVKNHHAGRSTERIADTLNITDYISTISTACSSAANAIMLGARMIKSKKLDRVIVGGTDSLAKFTINGFNTLMLLSEKECMPFDANRNGLNLGEGAAYLVLESEEIINKEKKKVLANISGYANANDAFHQTGSSDKGNGAFIAINKAIKSAKIKKEDIDYINMHGTATINNDLSEGAAIKRIFDPIPPFSSTKPYTGHTLAAAGAIEAVFSILALNNNTIFPNLNFKNKMPELNISPVTEITQKNLKNVLSNSFGFGGNCTALIFSKNE